MEGCVLSGRVATHGHGPMRRRLATAHRRITERIDDLRFPEAASGADHWQRAVMNAAVDDHIASLGPAQLSAAEISGDAHSDKPWSEFVSLDYPEFDICAPVEQAERFDVVICEQVLEHVIDPCAGAAGLRSLCKPGGHVIVTSPFLIKVHELPFYGLKDYWRFTPRGLRTLLEHVGLEVNTVEAWGNRPCVVGNLSRWSALRPWHSLRNDPDVPLQVWAFARRPA